MLKVYELYYTKVADFRKNFCSLNCCIYCHVSLLIKY